MFIILPSLNSYFVRITIYWLIFTLVLNPDIVSFTEFGFFTMCLSRSISAR